MFDHGKKYVDEVVEDVVEDVEDEAAAAAAVLRKAAAARQGRPLRAPTPGGHGRPS